MELLARAVRDDDVELAAIAVGGDSAGAVTARLDALAAEVAPSLRERAGIPRLRALLRAFHRDLRFAAPDRYDDPELHRLGSVLERRLGSPVALAVALIALGRRVGVELAPIAFPGHFLVRAIERPLFIEPCTGAMPIPEDGLRRAALELGLDAPVIEAALERAGARAVATRLLENLAEAHRARGDRGRALAVEERLLALGGPEARAQRAVAAWLRTMGPEIASARRLIVDRRGHSFRVDREAPVDLRRRRALPLILLRLAEHHGARAAHGLGWAALVEAGWPGEKMQAEAGWARLRTAIRTLRELGLRDVLLTLGSGYALDPSWDVVVE